MGWNFADGVGDSFGQAFAQARELKAQKDKAAQNAITDRLKTGMDGTKAVLDLADKIEDPNIKAQLYTHGVAPMVKLLTGYDTGTITPEMLQDPTVKAAIDTAHDLTATYLSQTPDPTTKKPMSLNEYKLKMGLTFAASKAAKEQFGPINDMMSSIDRNVKSNIPGAGNTDTTGVVDPIQGTATPLTNTATGQPTMSPPASATPPKAVDPNKSRASLESGIARDEKTLQALVNPPKGKAGLPDVSGNGIANLFKRGGKSPAWSDYSQQEQAQLAGAQSTVQRLTANLDSVNQIRQDQGLEPIQISPAVAAFADKLSKVSGIPGGSGASGANGDKDALAFLASKHPELKNPTPADIAWARTKVSQGTTSFKDSKYAKGK